MKTRNYAEYVSPGHPDRLADAIANQVVCRAQCTFLQTPNPSRSLAGIEVAIHDSTVFIDGRVALQRLDDPLYQVPIDFRFLAKEAYSLAGYNRTWGPPPSSLKVIARVCEEELGADEASIRSYSDDQNIVIGYAVARPETNFVPPAHWLAHHLGNALWTFRQSAAAKFGPDFKVLVDLDDGGTSVTWRKLVVSIQHAAGVSMEEQHRVLVPVLANALETAETGGLAGAASTFSDQLLHLNGAGDFVIGGPRGDNGLSGKKLVVDHYGPSVPIGGGALSGKDSWKVDRCGPLRARQLAKKLVASGCHEARVALGWAPGEDIPSLRDVEVRRRPGDDWSEVPAPKLPVPHWFAIESIVNDLELTFIDWTAIPRQGTFIDPREPWERV